MIKNATVLIDQKEMLCSIIHHTGKDDSFDSDDDVLLSHVANKLKGM